MKALEKSIEPVSSQSHVENKIVKPAREREPLESSSSESENLLNDVASECSPDVCDSPIVKNE